jgi:hypothetical protein
MARTTKLIEAPRLTDLVTSQGTTKGLTSLVNDYLAALVDPLVLDWSLDVRFLNKRMDPQWFFTITTLDGGPTLATPFTLSVLQNTSAADLQTVVNALYLAVLPAQFISDARYTKLDSDQQGQAKQFCVAHLRNANATAKINYGASVWGDGLSSGLVAAVQAADRFAVWAQGGVGQAAEANAQIILPFSGQLRNLRVFPNVPVTAPAVCDIFARINGVSTALTVQFNNAAGVVPQIDAGYVAVTAGDLFAFLITCDNGAAPAANFQASIEYVH